MSKEQLSVPSHSVKSAPTSKHSLAAEMLPTNKSTLLMTKSASSSQLSQLNAAKSVSTNQLAQISAVKSVSANQISTSNQTQKLIGKIYWSFKC